jgi:hypothetical protein
MTISAEKGNHHERRVTVDEDQISRLTSNVDDAAEVYDGFIRSSIQRPDFWDLSII